MNTTPLQPTVQQEDQQHEFLVFQLENAEYAVDVLKIQEIRHYEKPIAMANAPAFIKGVIPIRDNIVPLIDIRSLLHLKPRDYSDLNIIIILNLANQRTLGIVTDGVSDVLKLAQDQIKPTTEFNMIIHRDYVQGVGILNERALVIIDIEKLFSYETLDLKENQI